MPTKIDRYRENLEVRDSKISGGGVFTKIKIDRGQTICNLEGERINLNEMINRVNQGAERGSDPLQTGDEEYLDLDEFSRTFNHSCNPNSFIRGKKELVALKKIEAGEEVTYDYSSTMDDNYKNASRGIWTNKCNCGSKNCRGSVDQFRLLTKKIREFYLENRYAPDFILKKFSQAKA
ncbi:MAG TPA: SET domain-containing protein-lysine N-methyltransferase [Candidatus Aquilonibacter sp.]|nr:SET domain-containing protein-lysine N-methyltransferase [Candidatus Aquilonibacter sp.]